MTEFCQLCDRQLVPGVEHTCEREVADPLQHDITCRHCGAIIGVHVVGGGLKDKSAAFVIISIARLQCTKCKRYQRFRPSPV